MICLAVRPSGSIFLYICSLNLKMEHLLPVRYLLINRSVMLFHQCWISNFSICCKHLVTRSQPAAFSYTTFSFSLANIFFSCSARKRMSVIMRTPSGKIRLYCKGAVSVCLSPWQHVTAHRCTSHKTRVLKCPSVQSFFFFFLSWCLCSEQI